MGLSELPPWILRPGYLSSTSLIERKGRWYFQGFSCLPFILFKTYVRIHWTVTDYLMHITQLSVPKNVLPLRKRIDCMTHPVRSFYDVYYQSNKFLNIMWHHDQRTSKEICSVCSFCRILILVLLHCPDYYSCTRETCRGGVYTHLKTNIVIITLLFVFHKAAKNFKTVIECLYIIIIGALWR